MTHNQKRVHLTEKLWKWYNTIGIPTKCHECGEDLPVDSDAISKLKGSCNRALYCLDCADRMAIT